MPPYNQVIRAGFPNRYFKAMDPAPVTDPVARKDEFSFNATMVIKIFLHYR